MTARQTYHHGALAPALVEAGLELARTGGSDAVVLREATRRAGVTANAAYRHFANREALLAAVAAAALARLAEAMEARIAEATASCADPRERAVAHLRAVGESYIAFALAEPGWFDAAFFAVSDMSTAGAADAAGRPRTSPFHLLGAALDDLIAVGLVAGEERAGADIFCWSAVHGYAVLATRGPLRALDADRVAALADRVVALAIAGVRTS